jgi:hypothetical protein
LGWGLLNTSSMGARPPTGPTRLRGVWFRRPDTELGLLNPIEQILQVRWVLRFRRPEAE